MEKVGKIVTTETKSLEMMEEFEMALPYLEMEEFYGDRNLASVGET